MGAYERWLFRRDGHLYLHTETDGPGILRHGVQHWEEEITEDDARSRYPSAWAELTRNEQG